MRIVLCQMQSVDDFKANLGSMLSMMTKHLSSQTESEKIDLFVFPENTLYFRINENENVQGLDLNSDEIVQLEQFANVHKVFIHFTTAMKQDGSVWNASVLIRPQQKAEIVYRKVHLFDIKLEGQKPIRESDQFRHGDCATTFDVNGVKFGSSICYDVRFAELYSQLVRQDVDVILVPAAFLVKTGHAHWEVLLRARAIESQAYVLAPGQVGEHKSTRSEQVRMTYGHSLAVDPWGTVIHCEPGHIGGFAVVVDLEKIRTVRRQIPMKDHRRLL